MSARWTVRRLTVVAAVFATATLIAACSDATPGNTDDDAASEAESDAPIAIGFVGELTGPFAVWGIPARNGMQMAVDELNAAGGVAERELRLVERDTQSNPDEGVTALRGLIDRDGVVAAGGLVSSDVALAVSRIAESEHVPLFLVKAGSDQILTRASRYTFRTCLAAAPMNLDPIVEFIQREQITRVGVIVADYAWGRAIEAAVIDRFGQLPEIIVQIEVAPVQESEFTPYLRRLGALDPELLIATGHPPGAMPMTRQAAELGMTAFVTGSNSPAATVMETVGDAAFDRYVDFSCADYDSDSYQDLARRYYERFGTFMEDDAVSGYGQVLMVAEAIEATGSTQPSDIADYLHANVFDLPGYAWPLQWTAWGELANSEPLLTILRQRTPPDGVNPTASWYPEVLFRPAPLEPYEP